MRDQETQKQINIIDEFIDRSNRVWLAYFDQDNKKHLPNDDRYVIAVEGMPSYILLNQVEALVYMSKLRNIYGVC